ncbi:MAG: class I SAM-dependent methyltransferase [Peptococcaceae bacterium]|nr:class I SAM-dependent methyltransferase [Peptococcaceae bacterium]
MLSFAWFYEKIYPRIEPRRIREQRRAIAGKARRAVLEIGVGNGLNLPYYRRSTDITGIDPDRRLLTYAYRRSTDNTRLIPGHAEELPFKDESFDTVVSTFTFCSVRNPCRVATEIRRVLKTEGCFLFMEHVVSGNQVWHSLQRWLQPCWGRLFGGCCLTRKTLDIFKQAGLEIIELQRLSGGLLPIVSGTALKTPFNNYDNPGGDKNGRQKVAYTNFG